MERATILGIYDFIGYSLCRYLLDLGTEVVGIHPAVKIEDYFTEEKRLEIGRNANFTEIGLQDWKEEAAEGFLFVALFEALQGQEGTKGSLEAIFSKLESRYLKKLPTAVILPAYYAHENGRMKEVGAKISTLIHSHESTMLTIYLPAIYGPWQPEKFYFQQAMICASKGGKIPAISDWEWTHDCLYIEDAVKTIKEMAESGQQGHYILSSGEQDRWLQCAEELVGLDPVILRKEMEKPVLKRSIQVRTIRKNEQISKGLIRQKEHFTRIQDSRV
jgi:nucleoside-diphosphate-sugar epimerase